MLRFKMQCSPWFAAVLVVSMVALFTTTWANAAYVNPTVFSDEFNVDGAPNATNWPTVTVIEGTVAVASGSVDLDSPVPGTNNNSFMLSKSFTLGTEYAGEVRFRVMSDVTLTTSYLQHTPYMLMMADGNGSQKGAFDVNLMQGSATTFYLTWGYWGGTGSNALTNIATLNKDTWYTVISNRKSDGTVDIYLDDVLIATKTALAGTPSKWMIGDTYGTYVAGHVQADYVRVGTFVVPEPCSMMLLAPAVCGLLAAKRKSRK